jgi:hypothetical protein
MPETEPRRLVNADVIRMQHELSMAQATRAAEPYVTVEFTRNAKGETQISTKVSAPSGATLTELNELSERVLRVAKVTYGESVLAHPFGGAA